ncbi:MAG: hypothetical protein IKF39_00235 [Oscillospiraceae bacterium]|nr:hypothetical protein [Oscillospiraceae bacterium]
MRGKSRKMEKEKALENVTETAALVIKSRPAIDARISLEDLVKRMILDRVKELKGADIAS